MKLLEGEWMPQNSFNDKSLLVYQTPSHYLSQFWPRCMSSYGVIMPHCGQVTHICISTNIVSENGLLPVWCQAITWNKAAETMLPYCQLHHKKHISVKSYLEFKSFQSKKCTWKCRLLNDIHLSQPECVKFMALFNQIFDLKRKHVFIMILRVNAVKIYAVVLETNINCISPY